MRTLRQFMWAAMVAIAPGVALLPTSSGAQPVLRLHVAGATYDQGLESWVGSPVSGDPFRLWAIGDVPEGGGKRTVHDARLSFAHENPGSPVTGTAMPSAGGGFNGVDELSMPGIPPLSRIVDDGGVAMLNDGQALPARGVGGDGVIWREFSIGDFGDTDSPGGAS